MDPDIAAMVVSLGLSLTVGAVILLRPITKRLGAYLEVLAEKQRMQVAAPSADDSGVLAALKNIERRVARLEERQAFTDSLQAGRRPAELPARSKSDPVGDEVI